ncbi:MAG: EamA family transporter [Candidatus Nanoarchaeia archaeon]
MEQATLLLYILLSVSLNSIGQVVWRKGAGGALKKISIKNIIKMLMKPLVIMGLCIYVLSALLWIMVLSNTEVSYAFPFIALGYVIVAIMSKFLLKEEIKPMRILGIIIIVSGVIIVGVSM